MPPLSRVKAACTFHDRVNLLALPVLGTLAAAGLFGLYSATKVTNMFVMYIVADALWIWVEPDALPSLPQVVMAHHLVTIVLLLFPLRHPEFAHFTCWDGIVEINTFFLIARRQWKAQRKFMNYCYWATFLPMRLVLYPYLLFRFWFALEGFGLERVAVAICQFLLCGFNGAMIYASAMRRIRRVSSRDDLWGLANLTPATPQEKAAYKEDKAREQAAQSQRHLQSPSREKASCKHTGVQPVIITAQAGY